MRIDSHRTIGMALALSSAWLLTTSSVAQPFVQIPQEVPGFASASLAWGDYDNDGDFDLLIGGGTAAGHQTLLFQNANGALIPGPFAAQSAFTGAVAWADFDGDGDLDFASGGFSRFLDGPVFPLLNARLFRNDQASGFVALEDALNTSGVPLWADFDRDGDLDLLIAGADNGEAASADLDLRRLRIFLNEPGKPWRLGWEHVLPANPRLPLVDDWDHDGWPDIVYAYNRNDDTKALVWLRNESNLQFQRSETDFSGFAWPYFMDWGDFGNDGDLDAAFTGEIGASRVLKLIRHDAGGNVPFDVPGVGGLAIAWVDYDNDGRLDLSTTEGPDGDLGSILRLHRNQSTGPDPDFGSQDLPFRGAGYSTLSWVDFDGDDDSDLIVTGLTNQIPSFRLLRNETAVPNLPPTVPTALTSNVGAGGSVELQWQAATDPNQSAGLTYNVRVGLTPGAADVVSPAADLVTGRLRSPQRGNAGSSLRLVLTNLLAGAYRWSVEAVDHGFRASAFAGEVGFVIPPGPPRAREVGYTALDTRHVAFTGEALANGAPGSAWFEFGTSTQYGETTAKTEVGNGVTWIPVQADSKALEAEVTYHFQLVVSNSVGVATSPDVSIVIPNSPPVFELPARIVTAPNTPAAPVEIFVGDLETLPTELKLTATILSGFGQNPNLLTPGGISLGGEGEIRTLTLTPEPKERGTVRVLLTLTDGHGATTTRGVDFWVQDFSRALLLSADPGSGIWVDVDRDGLLDLLGNLRWFRHKEGGGLAERSGGVPNALSGAFAVADADHDGDVDFAVTGLRGGTRVMQVYTNRPATGGGDPVFGTSSTPLRPGFTDASVGWADYDADGDPDLFAFGATNNAPLSAFASQGWRNDGNLRFELLDGVLPKLSLGSMAWADFDGDGDLDVCLLGSTNRIATGATTRLFRNDGAGNLTDSEIVLPGLFRGFASWGDADNDGRLDLLLSGFQQVNGRTTNLVALYHQQGDGTFAESARFEPLADADGSLVDFDGDGNLDVAYAGREGDFGANWSLKLYLFEGGTFRDVSPLDPGGGPSPAFGDYDGDGDLDLLDGRAVMLNNSPTQNVPPSVPGGLNAQVNGNAVTLTWMAASDANQTGGHTYNLRMGTTPGGIEIVSPLADPTTGWRFVVAAGNASASRLWNLRDLPAGTYYWSVQAIDHSYAGGPFAAEQVFSIGLAPRFARILPADDAGFIRLEVESPAAGRFELKTSLNLKDWSGVGFHDLPKGASVIHFLPGVEPARFFRLEGE